MKAKERELNKKAWKDRRFFHVFSVVLRSDRNEDITGNDCEK